MNAEGVRLFDQACYNESIQYFQQAAFTDPNNADAYYNLAAAYHRIGATGNRPAELTQAERYYNQCLDRAPDHRECHRGLAVLLLQQGRADEAFRLLQGWVDRSPCLADARVELARLYEETGDRESAKQNLVDALKYDQRNARALAALGHIREQSGETREAMVAYQRSLASDRFQPEVAARLEALQGYTPAGLPCSCQAGTMVAEAPALPSGGVAAPSGQTPSILASRPQPTLASPEGATPSSPPTPTPGPLGGTIR
jgi:tetratricopeptide (TPR) repeat protein